MVDVADGEVSNSVMIAFLPTNSDWCKQALPHMTLVYAGSKDDLSPGDFSEMVKDAADVALLTSPFCMDVAGIEVFGPDNDKVNVLQFKTTPEILAIRRMVEQWNQSEFSFNPHATIGPVSAGVPVYPPTVVGFDRLVVAWGEDHIVFNLKTKY